MALEPASLAQLKANLCLKEPALCSLLAHPVGRNPSPKGFSSGPSGGDCHPDFGTLKFGRAPPIFLHLDPGLSLCPFVLLCPPPRFSPGLSC